MTFVDMTNFSRGPLIPGRAYDTINRFFCSFGQVDVANHIDRDEALASSRLNALEDRLRYIQETLSEVSMHLPTGFAAGLNRQFANMMDEDAWEEEDELVSPHALTAFILILLNTKTKRRPGIGSNGRGSITACWTVGNDHLTIECLPTEKVSVILTRQRPDGEIERAAIGPIPPNRVLDVLGPFKPEVWFDG